MRRTLQGGTDDGAPEETHRQIRDVVLTMTNVNGKILCVTSHCLRICESTPTIHSSKGGSRSERLSSLIVTFSLFRYGVSARSLTYS